MALDPSPQVSSLTGVSNNVNDGCVDVKHAELERWSEQLRQLLLTLWFTPVLLLQGLAVHSRQLGFLTYFSELFYFYNDNKMIRQVPQKLILLLHQTPRPTLSLTSLEDGGRRTLRSSAQLSLSGEQRWLHLVQL